MLKKILMKIKYGQFYRCKLLTNLNELKMIDRVGRDLTLLTSCSNAYFA